ncbi:MAG: YbfB/YjiJ family MFS transporter, partial [Acetobacteraceae bacterium]|nr:YbfB/YjiJ family MFS transporter [Acetobacteraceae bacterium]
GMRMQPDAVTGAVHHHEAILVALAGSIALAAALGIGRFVYTPILPPMVEALALTKSTAGLIASANFLGYLIGALLVASPLLAGSRRMWLLGALAMSAITTGAMGLANSVAAFVVLRFVGGAASAFVLVLASTLVLERLAEAGHAGLSALCFAGVGIGIAISAVLVAAVLRAGQNWQSLWLASGAFSLVAAIVVGMLLRPHSALAQRHELEKRATTRNLLRLIAAYGLFGFGYVITATFLVTIVRATPTVRSLEPVIWFVFGLAAAPSVAFWSRIGTSRGASRAFALACLVEAIGVAASVIWQTELGIFLSAVLVGGTFMGLTALGLIRARTLAVGEPHRVLAYMTGAFGTGQIIGPAFAGVLSDWLGGFTVPSIAAVIALILAALLACR